MKPSEKFRKNTIDAIFNNPKKTLVGFFIALTLFLPGILLVKPNFTYKAWYSDNDPQVQQFQEFEKVFGNDDNIIIGLYHPNGILDKKSLKLIQELTDTLWKTMDVVRVDSLTNYQAIESEEDDILIESLVPNSLDNLDQSKLKNKIDNDPLLENFLISSDRKATLVKGTIRPAIDSIPDHSAITNEIKAKLEKFRKDNPDYTIHLTGTVPIVDDFKVATLNDMAKLIPILYTVLTLILWWRYRSVMALVYTFSTISLASLFMAGSAGYLGQTLNTLTSATPTILMTIALSDAVHIFSALFLGLKGGYSLNSSLYYSMHKNFYPTLLTSLTTALGFLSFFNALVEPVAELGVVVSVGIVFAWIVTYFFLAPAIKVSEKYFKNFITGDKESVKLEKEIIATPSSFKLSNWIFKYRLQIVALTFILGFASLPLIKSLRVNMDPYKQFQEDHPSVIAQNFLSEKFNYASFIEMQIDSGKMDGAKDPEFLQTVESFIKMLESYPEITKVISINAILKRLNKVLNQDQKDYYKIPETRGMIAESLFLYTMGLPQGNDINNLISLKNDQVHLTMQWHLSDSHNSRMMFKKIKKFAKDFGLKLKITGKTPLFHELTPYVVEAFLFSIIMAFITITIVLMISLQSFVLGALALIPNLFPLLIGGAIYYLSGHHIDMGTVLVASVCLGIAVDDSIHFLFEYKKYRLIDNPIDSVAKLFTSTFPALILTTVLISIGFLSFIFGSYIPNIKFGVLCAFIIVVALLADLIILPAVVFLLDKNKKNGIII
jgi:predicted RND superfamily exporter protein